MKKLSDKDWLFTHYSFWYDTFKSACAVSNIELAEFCFTYLLILDEFSEGL